jgi:predicted transcriptional regulator
MEALRLLTSEHWRPMLLAVMEEGRMEGIVTEQDVLHALALKRDMR